MKINVTENKVSIKEEQILNENEYNIHKIQFDFSSEYTDDLVKVALFSIDNHTYKKIISNNECDIPPEVLTQRGYSILGVYAYKTEQDTLVLRYSPSPTRISVYDGSYKAEAENSEPITPSEIEQYQQILQNSLQNFQNEFNTLAQNTETSITEIEEELQRKVDEGYFDGEDGYTPQKGVDYFTQEDIEEIEGDILNEVYTKSETDTLLEGKADTTDIPDVSSFITKDVNNLTNYTLKTNTGSLIDLEINDTTYVVTLKLKNQDGTVISTDTIDLPLESVVVSGRYDNTTKKVILTLENGSEVDFSVADLVAGLQTEITSQNKLASDLIDDTNNGNKFVTTSEKQTWNNKYDKPNNGIPKTDLASDVQTSLGKADTAIQSHQDISGKEDETNKVTSIDNTSTDTQYPSAKCVYDSQEEQNTEIENLQTENARLKAILPTITGEGQAITLNKTAELEFVKPPLPMGNSEQVQYSGKNLFNLTAEDFQNGETLGAGKKVVLTLKPNTSYTLSSNEAEGSSTETNIWFNGTSSSENGVGINRPKTAQTNSNGELYISIRGNKVNSIFQNYWVQLEEGTAATSYEPYVGGTASPNPDYPQEITNVTGDVEVKVQNKNLFDKNNMQNGFIPLSGDYPTSNPSYPNARYYLVPVKANDSVAISGSTNNFGRVRCIDNVSNQVIGTISTSENDYYTSNNNYSSGFVNAVITAKKDIILAFMVIQGTDTLDTFQVEYGSTATLYTQHHEQTFTFPLGNEKLMLGDYLADDGIHHVRGQDIFDGSEDEVWEKIYGSIENGIALYSVNKNHKQIDGLSDKFIMRNSLSIWYNGEGVTTKWRADKIGFMIDAERINNDYSISAIRNLMNNNPVTVEYGLEEEVIVPYTSAQQTVYNAIKQSLSYEEQTNISSNQNAIFNVEAYLDTKEVLDNKVDKVTGKGLSTNDFTNTYKNSVDSNTSARHTHSNKDTLDSITSADINNWNNKANMSDIPDTSNFITNAVNNLINYYLKSEIYTKTEVTNLISAIEKATFEIVNELPATGQSNVIYLVPSANPKTQNIKDEYIWLNNAWEQIGSTQVDLTGYATEAWVNTQISGFLTQVQEAIDTFGGYSGLLNTTELNDNKIKIDKVSFNSIFVATTGNDATGNGSYNKPYKTITYAISKAIAGQTIYVRGGTYKENIVFNKSGEEGKYIGLRNYPTETAIVDCTSKTAEAVVDFNSNSYIKVIGLELCNLTQKTDAVFGVLARGGESNLVIANLNIHNINGKSAKNGHANGIKIVGLDETKPCEHILIQNNHIHDCVCGWSEALTVTANSQYVDVIGNKVHDNGNIGIDIAGNFGDCPTESLDFARYVYVAENEVYNCNSGNADCAGIYCDGASNVIFARNKSYNNQVGLEIGSEEMPASEAWLPHNNLAINNLIYNNSVRQVGLGGYSTETGKTFNTLLWNNTIIHPSNGTDVALSMNAGENYSIVNNIIISLGTWNYLINSDLDTTYVKNFLFYNNLLYHANAQWMDAYLNIAGTEYHTETFQNADFTENNIITDSYGLNADYTLAVDSPCIGAGYFADKILEFLDLAGNKRTETIDIGCYKYI